MRKIIAQEMLTVDGFFCGPKGEIDWHHVDAEFNEYAIGVLDSVDLLIFGRITYELMASYWPTPAAVKDDARIAEKMNNLKKIYFSRQPESTPWNNSTVLGDINPQEIQKLKEAKGKDMIMYGSGVIVEAFTKLGLIDEYRFIVNPVMLGKGRTLFPTLEKQKELKLLRTETFASGNVLACYALK